MTMNALSYITGLKRDLRIFRDLDGLLKVHNAIDMAVALQLVDPRIAESIRKELPEKKQVWMEQRARQDAR